MRRLLPLASALAVLAHAGCGYGFTQRYSAAGGIDRIHVRPFVNASTEAELGAVVTAALRTELARRGADAPEGQGAAVLQGEVRATEPVVTAGTGTTWRVGIELSARLVPATGKPVERTIRRDTDYLGGADPLETEGRRALALRRVVDDAARELLRSFER
jgi:hypothetical protein